MTSIKPYYVIDRLNRIFGIEAWDSQEQSRHVYEKEVVMTVRLVIYGGDRRFSREADGCCEITGSVGEAIKGARTNAICKAASMLGIGLEVYLGDTGEKGAGEPSQERSDHSVQPRPPTKRLGKWDPGRKIVEFSQIKGKPIPDGFTWRSLYQKEKKFLKFLVEKGRPDDKQKADRTIKICSREEGAHELWRGVVLSLMSVDDILDMGDPDSWIAIHFDMGESFKTIKAADEYYAYVLSATMELQILVTLVEETNRFYGVENTRRILAEESEKLGLERPSDAPLTPGVTASMMDAVRKRKGDASLKEADMPF